MAGITPGKIVCIVVVIVFMFIAISIFIPLVIGIGTQSPDSMCKWNAAMNSVTVAHAWKLAPNFACHARAVVLDAEGKTTVFKNALGNVEECSCDQFYGPIVDFSPSSTVDNNIFTYSRIPVHNNESEIIISVFDKTRLGRVEIYFNNPVTANYTIYTKEKRFFWADYQKCIEKTLSLDDEINVDVISPYCTLDETQGSAIKIIFTDIDRDVLPIEIKEIHLYDSNFAKIPIKQIYFRYYTINEQQDACIADSNALDTKLCTPMWQMRWATKRIAELAMRCWQMGGTGGYTGDFDCFAGCVYYNSDESEEISYSTIKQALSDNYFRSSIEDEHVPYSTLLSIEDMSVEQTDSLENGKCFYMKYHRGSLMVITIPGTYVPLVIPEDEPKVILTFGRTIEEARRDL
jgi:hypothetical protein